VLAKLPAVGGRRDLVAHHQDVLGGERQVAAGKWHHLAVQTHQRRAPRGEMEVRAAELDELAQEPVERTLELGTGDGRPAARSGGLAGPLCAAHRVPDLDADLEQSALAARLHPVAAARYLDFAGQVVAELERQPALLGDRRLEPVLELLARDRVLAAGQAGLALDQRGGSPGRDLHQVRTALQRAAHGALDRLGNAHLSILARPHDFDAPRGMNSAVPAFRRAEESPR
jgi:hypothetical protein